MIQKILRPNVSRDDFLKTAVNTNKKVLTVFSVFSALVEIVNLIMLCSVSGINTYENRVSFLIYFSICIISAFFIIFDNRVNIDDKKRNLFYNIYMAFLILAQTLFNVYNIYSFDTGFAITIVTNIMAFSAMFIMRPAYALANITLNYIVFIAYVQAVFMTHWLINLTIGFLFCLAVYFLRYSHTCFEIVRKREIDNMNSEIASEKHLFALTREQFELISRSGRFISFEWDVKSGDINFTKEWEEIFNEPVYIKNFDNYIKNSKLLDEKQKSEIIKCMENVRNNVKYQKHEFLIPTKSGKRKWFEVQIATQTNQNGEAEYGIGLMFDIMGQKEKIVRLEQRVKMDSFTGTFNKTAIERYGVGMLEKLSLNERLVMLILDMDNFKSVNDSFGHPCGDYALKNAAEIMLNIFPENAKGGRLGGDGYMDLVVATEISQVMLMHNYSVNVIHSINKILWHNKRLNLSCSVGMAVASQGETYNALYKKADSALYMAKKLGKGRVYWNSVNGV